MYAEEKKNDDVFMKRKEERRVGKKQSQIGASRGGGKNKPAKYKYACHEWLQCGQIRRMDMP